MCIYFRYTILVMIAVGAIGVNGGVASGTSLAAGVFFGTFDSTCGNGSFALTAATGNAEGVFLATKSDGETYRAERLVVNADNELQIQAFFNSQTTISGQISGTHFTGIITGGNCSGALSGTMAQESTETAAIAGFYSDPVDVTRYQFRCTGYFLGVCIREDWALVESFQAQMSLIVAQEGSGYLLFESPRSTVPNDGGPVRFAFDDAGLIQDYRTSCSGVDSICYLVNGTIYGWIDDYESSHPLFVPRYHVNIAEGFFANGLGSMRRDGTLLQADRNSLPWLLLLLD